MKRVVAISSILSWVNLVIGSLLVFGGVLGSLVSGNVTAAFLSAVLVGTIVLHSYAALQLRKSVLDPSVPLSQNTPAGIRIIGYIALFISVMNISNGLLLVRNTPEVLEQLKTQLSQLQAQSKAVNLNSMVKAIGYFMIFFGVSVVVNVSINLSLLRWYRAQQQQQ